jgi:hypothetical protein
MIDRLGIVLLNSPRLKYDIEIKVYIMRVVMHGNQLTYGPESILADV